ncbi:MAG: amidohydrolase family protein [Hyphomicrobiales bacterium]
MNLAFGSDTPVETLDPIAGIHAAATRQRPGATPAGGWYPGERISTADAIAAYTTGPAVATREHHRLGRIAPGYLADAVILTRNVLESPPESLLDTRVLATIAAGRLAYHADP